GLLPHRASGHPPGPRRQPRAVGQRHGRKGPVGQLPPASGGPHAVNHRAGSGRGPSRLVAGAARHPVGGGNAPPGPSCPARLLRAPVQRHLLPGPRGDAPRGRGGAVLRGAAPHNGPVRAHPGREGRPAPLGGGGTRAPGRRGDDAPGAGGAPACGGARAAVGAGLCDGQPPHPPHGDDGRAAGHELLGPGGLSSPVLRHGPLGGRRAVREFGQPVARLPPARLDLGAARGLALLPRGRRRGVGRGHHAVPGLPHQRGGARGALRICGHPDGRALGRADLRHLARRDRLDGDCAHRGGGALYPLARDPEGPRGRRRPGRRPDGGSTV
ncbi:MAG: Integral membrane protein, partial [uncultured Rubellimicrobium sp.]